MIEFLLYLLESSVVFVGFYLAYTLFLKNESFFTFNRFLLLSIPLVSLILPLLSLELFPGKSAINESIRDIGELRWSYHHALSTDQVEFLARESEWTWMGKIATFLIIIYVLGVVINLLKTSFSLYHLRRMIEKYPTKYVDGVWIIQLPKEVAPFSFWGYMFAHGEFLGSPDFEGVLSHERIHLKQRHSLDLVFLQIIGAFLWFNPLIWRLIESLKITHEYIVDKKMINSGYSLVEYQTMLLSQVISNNSYRLVHNFNFSFIKKRITMMNIKSGWAGQIKLGLVLTLIITGSALMANTKFSLEPLEQSGYSTIDFYMDGSLIEIADKSAGIDYDHTRSAEFKGDFEFRLNGVPSQRLDMEITLVKEGVAAGSVKKEGWREGQSIDLTELISKADSGDAFVLEIRGGSHRIPRFNTFFIN